MREGEFLTWFGLIQSVVIDIHALSVHVCVLIHIAHNYVLTISY